MSRRESTIQTCLWSLLVLVPITLSMKQCQVQAFGEIPTAYYGGFLAPATGVCTSDSREFSAVDTEFKITDSGVVLEDTSGNMRHPDLETVQSWKVDFPDSGGNGITFDILQNVQACVEFYSLPEDSESMEVALVQRGQNSVLDGSVPNVLMHVTALDTGPYVHIRVGDHTEGYSPLLLWSLALVTLLVVAGAKWSWLALRTRQESDVRADRAGESQEQEYLISAKTFCTEVCDKHGLHKATRQDDSGLLCTECHQNKSPTSTSEGGDATEVDDGCSQRSNGHCVNRRENTSRITTMTAGHASATSSQQQVKMDRLTPSALRPNVPRHRLMTSRLMTSSSHINLRRLLLLSLSLAALMAVAVGVSSLKKDYTLQIGVPTSTLIRKVRMYTEQPDLKEVARNLKSSLNLVSRLQLLDLKSCHGNLSECETVAVCDGGSNDLVCRCQRGYYFQDQQCKECSKSCPDGHYLITPCSAGTDVICKPCTSCSGSQYEAASCTTTRDSICVDVTFPVGILPINGSMSYDDIGTKIDVAHSSNIFMERLIHMKELETPMYVTNNQQSMDFVWHRESGMDIIISVSGVYLLPEYRELDVADDSIFFQQKARLTETQRVMDLFAETQEKYCKRPVPDYYDLILQVTRNRTSAAKVVFCDSRDNTLPRCPSSYKDGDRYLKWDINAKCDKYAATGTNNVTLIPLQGHINEVVCMEETQLDTSVFRMSRPATLEMMFPSAECSLYQRDCNACLSAAKCTNASDHHSCCGLSCYNQQACHQAFSPACPPAEVECASGEVRVFILQPVFSTMAHKFNCYLTYDPPTHLYNVSYSLLIPSLGFTVPLQNYTASVQSTDKHHHSADSFDFIQLWHDTRMPVTDDMILSGDHAELEENGDIHMKPFTIHTLKQGHEFSQDEGFTVKSEGNSVYTTAVQFERPFLYSSTTWNKGGCRKNASQIFPNQTVHKRDATRVLARKQQDKFVYQMYHAERSPYIKFSVAEGSSVLRWFQGKTTHGTLIGEELSGQLTWDAVQGRWTIVISGSVKNCPAIFAVQVFNKVMHSCVGIYDVLAACPDRFNLTLNIAHTEHKELPDIFVIFLNDSETSHRLVLSSIIAPVILPPAELLAVSGSSKSAEGNLEMWVPVFAVVILFVLGIIVVFTVYLYIKFKSVKAASDASQTTNQAEVPALNNQSNNRAAQKAAESKPKTSSSARTCMCAFVILYIVYSVVFTFSIILVILYFTHLSLTGNISGITDFSTQLQKELNASFMKVQTHETQEEIRMFQSVESRLRACSHHLQNQNREFLHNYHSSVGQFLTLVFQKDGAIESLTGQSILQNTSVYSQEIQQFLLDCNKTVQSILERFESHFAIYAKDIMRNSWLDFPRGIFLEQEGDNPDRKYMSSGQIADFLHWLQVAKTDELLLVRETVAAGLGAIKLPSPEDYLKQAVKLPISDFAPSLPPEPMVAGHTFLVLQPPEAGSSAPAFYTDASSTSEPKPKAAFFHSGNTNDELKLQGSNAGKVSALESEGMNASDDASSSSVDGQDSSLFMYILIGLFVLIDVLMFVYRMSWMVTQVRAAKEGYEDRIPTDIVSQKILAIQSGYHISRMQDLYEPYSYHMENKENMITSEERASETEFNVYFCQSYPKSKDDILREIMAQKMSSQEKGLGGNEQVGVPKSQQRLKKFGVIRECGSCFRWLHRVLISHLVWRFVMTTILLLFVCLLVYAADYWLTADSLRVLVGGQSAAKDLQLQVHMTNHHLAGMADHLSTVLEKHRAAVSAEITVSTALIASTLDTQRQLLLTLLESVCQGASTPACSTSLHSFLPLASLPAWQACNFLPVRPHLYQDLSTEHLEQMVSQQLSPLLDAFKSCLFSLAAILMAVLCVMFLCHASASVARYYMLIWGKLPRVQIYQISENTSLLYDGGPGSGKPMQRSASWLESCESGVYVGESEDTNTNRDV